LSSGLLSSTLLLNLDKERANDLSIDWPERC
jgi:hypothetical protein